MSTTFFTADLHFGHAFMARLRGYPSVENMDYTMAEVWNTQVTAKDTVYFLGDFSFHRKEQTEAIFNELPGHKHLIRGNHDPNRVCKLDWVTSTDTLSRRVNGRSYFMSHYPHLTWPNAHHGVRHLHGHSHGNLGNPTRTTRMDVGLDCHPKGLLFSVDEIEEAFSQLEYDNVDHHD